MGHRHSGKRDHPAHFARLTGARTVNNGQSGFVSRQNLAALLDVIDRGEALDLAVFYDGVNEVLVLCRSADALTGHLEERRMRRELQRSGVDSRWLWDSLFGATVPFLTKAVNKVAAAAGRRPLIVLGGRAAVSACQPKPRLQRPVEPQDGGPRELAKLARRQDARHRLEEVRQLLGRQEQAAADGPSALLQDRPMYRRLATGSAALGDTE